MALLRSTDTAEGTVSCGLRDSGACTIPLRNDQVLKRYGVEDLARFDRQIY